MALDGRVRHPGPGADEAPGRMDRLSRAQRIPRDPVGEVLIVRRDPRIAFRVVENQMNYAYLGNRLKQSAAENFPVFLADLVRAGRGCLHHALDASLAQGTRPGGIPVSRARRHCWNMRPIACSGAGTAATARPSGHASGRATRRMKPDG